MANLTGSAPPNSGSKINSYFMGKGPILHPVATIHHLTFLGFQSSSRHQELESEHYYEVNLTYFEYFLAL